MNFKLQSTIFTAMFLILPRESMAQGVSQVGNNDTTITVTTNSMITTPCTTSCLINLSATQPNAQNWTGLNSWTSQMTASGGEEINGLDGNSYEMLTVDGTVNPSVSATTASGVHIWPTLAPTSASYSFINGLSVNPVFDQCASCGVGQIELLPV